jgi:hypothetical protein
VVPHGATNLRRVTEIGKTLDTLRCANDTPSASRFVLNHSLKNSSPWLLTNGASQSPTGFGVRFVSDSRHTRNDMTKEQIRDEMIAYLVRRLDGYWHDQCEVTTTNSWGEEVKFLVSSAEIAAARESILHAAKEGIVLMLLNERCLDPLRLAGFAERWLKVAQTLLEEKADAVAAEL